MKTLMDEAARESLRAELLGLGFDEARFCSAGAAPGAPLRDWLDARMHADMHWMESTADKRMDPDLVHPGVRSLIILGVNYLSPDDRPPAPGDPRWARYALYSDYHDTLGRAVRAAVGVLAGRTGTVREDHRPYVDTGPVMERGWAARSGMGFQGKNGMLISRRHGNWLFLAAILTRVEIPPDPSLRKAAAISEGLPMPAGLYCGRCTLCLDACPTAAFPRPGVVDARRCVSYQTIENRGVIPRDLRPGVGDRVFGCDICLEVCPWNRFARAGRRVLLAARDDLRDLRLADLLELTPVAFAERFRRTAVKRLKLPGLLRNACVAAGNLGSDLAGADRGRVIKSLVRLASAEWPVVRVHAVWALHRLDPEGAASRLAAYRDAESDPVVLEEYEWWEKGTSVRDRDEGR